MTLRECAARLREEGCEDAMSVARTLFRHITGMTDTQLFGADPCCDAPALTGAVRRYTEGEPLDYILGYTDFYRERYHVTPAVLIPRPETELLVCCAIEHVREGAVILDLCTGSGCVGLSTLANTKGTTATLVDLSEDALAVARENAHALGLSDRVRLIKSDVLHEVIDGHFDVILSNPPYVNDAVYDTLDRRLHAEPKMAFVGGEDGMDFYRAIVRGYTSRLGKGGFFVFEIGYDQADRMRALADEHALHCVIRRDLAGHDRIALLTAR